MPNNRRNGPEIDWGQEILHCVALVGKAFFKLFTWILNILLTVLLVGALTGIIVGGAFGLYLLTEVDASVDSIDFLKVEQEQTTRLYYTDKTLHEEGEIVEMEAERLSGTANRIWSSYEQFPQDLIDAIVAVEDKRFWTHPGVDFLTTVRCTLQYFTGTGMAGASSITQQLIKNVTGNDEVTIQRKAQEIMQALALERTMTKEQILELYLNTVYFGHRSDGVSAAAYTYFGKNVEDLTLVECAAIVGITQNPSKWDPYSYPENNRYRRRVVLTTMRDQGYITEEEYLDAWHAEITLVGEQEDEEDTGVFDGVNSWYVEAVIDESVELLMETYGYTMEIAKTKLYTGGLQIVTAQNPELQKIVETYYENPDNFERLDDSLIQPESSFVLMDPKNGDVLAIVGARGEKKANRILNYATKTKRPSGSCIKPISVYAPAIEYGLVNYGTVIDDSPVNFGTETVLEDGTIEYSRPAGYPQNATRRFDGLRTLHYAIRESINTVSYKTLMMLGIDRSFNFARNLCHLDSLIETREMDGYSITDKDYAPLALGQQSYGVTNLEITAAYSIFANEGVYNYPRFVTEIYDSDWNLIIDNKKESEIVISETTASLMTILLEEVVDVGTADDLKLNSYVDVAVKTGTTSSQGDRWIIGYTPYYLAGCWFGYAMPQPLVNYKRNPVNKTWDDVMLLIHEHILEEAERTGKPLKQFEIADGIIQATYCADSGKLVTDACLHDPRGSRVETGYYTPDQVPTEECDVHVMVLYDQVTGGVANPFCPTENLIEVSLLNIRRVYPFQIQIADAQYVFWDIASLGILPSGGINDPYFILAIPENMFAGITRGKTQYNHACQECIYIPPVTDVPETDPDPDEGGDPIPIS